jgi:hypothetical protein
VSAAGSTLSAIRQKKCLHTVCTISPDLSNALQDAQIAHMSLSRGMHPMNVCEFLSFLFAFVFASPFPGDGNILQIKLLKKTKSTASINFVDVLKN